MACRSLIYSLLFSLCKNLWMSLFIYSFLSSYLLIFTRSPSQWGTILKFLNTFCCIHVSLMDHEIMRLVSVNSVSSLTTIPSLWASPWWAHVLFIFISPRLRTVIHIVILQKYIYIEIQILQCSRALKIIGISWRYCKGGSKSPQ